jgi:hypothetical protein
MTYAEAISLCEELKGRFDLPFSPLDKHRIEQLYAEALGKEFHPTTCQQCYHDALIEITLYLRKNKRMKAKCQYRLRAGVIINCPNFHNGEIYTNNNLTDEVAAEYLKRYPQQADLFQALPEESPIPDSGEKADEATAEEDEAPEESPTPESGEKAVKGKKSK